MKKAHVHAILAAALLMLAPCAAGPAAAQYAAQAAGQGQGVSSGVPASFFSKDTTYDIYYEVSAYEVNRVENVRIIDTFSVAGVTFLRVRYPSISDREAFIVLASVKAIVPSASAKPMRSLYR